MPDLPSALKTLTELLSQMEPTEAILYVNHCIDQVRRSLPES